MLKRAVVALLLAAAFWPVWWWYVERFTDPSDEPLGILALVTFGFLLLLRKHHWQANISLTRMRVLLGIMIAYCTFWPVAPKTVHALFALAALGVCAGSGSPRGSLMPGEWMLLFLSLPLVSSLNFYLGFPLRQAVTWLSAIMLQLAGFAVVPEGTELVWGHKIVEVDAPCSGVKMLWFSFYLAGALAGYYKLSAKRTALLTLSAFVMALFGNVWRVDSLFFLEAGVIKVPPGGGFDKWLHEGVGAVVFAAVASAIAVTAQKLRSFKDLPVVGDAPLGAGAAPYGKPASSRLSAALLAVACLGAAALPSISWAPKVVPETIAFPGWPSEFAGRKIEPVPLSNAESRFLAGFPGKVAMFSDGRRQLIMRFVSRETRQLHPAADCYRGSGYTIEFLPLYLDGDGKRWNSFLAVKGNERLTVSERIYDLSGQTFSDVSAWYWKAVSGQSLPPWWAVTLVEKAP